MIATRLFFTLVCSLFLSGVIARATTTCVFKTNNTTKTMTLVSDCTTDSTMQIPAGFTLNGAGHLITAVDPTGGNFNGAVITNAVINSTINVKNLLIDMPNLATGNCFFVQGILLNQASGVLTGNTILHVAQSGHCPDTGTGISIGGPQDANQQVVTISGNRVLLASGQALMISGPVNATVTGNEFSINSLGSQAVVFGVASGSFTSNMIETDATGSPNQEAFIIFNNNSDVKITSNTINLVSGNAGTGIDLFIVAHPVTVRGNRVFNHGSGASAVGINNGNAANTITNNEIRCYQIPVAGPAGKGNVVLPCPF